MDAPSRPTWALFSTSRPLTPPVTVMWLIATRCAPLTVITSAFAAVTTAEPLPSSVRPLVVMLTAPVHVPKTLRVVSSSADMTALAQLRRFEHFKVPKWLRLLRPTPKGRHYSGIGGTGPAVILGGGWAGSSSLSF